MEPQSHSPPSAHHGNGRWAKTNGINLNTAVSLGLVGSIIWATWFLSGLMSKEEMRLTAMDLRITANDAKITNTKETWTDGDMFRWAVHLQKENPTLKIPEPENHSGR